jgi:hypothetical protein
VERPDPARTAEEEFVAQFKKLLLPYLSERTDASLLSHDKKDALKAHLTELVDRKLVENKIPIGGKLRQALLDSIFAGVSILDSVTKNPPPS